MSYVYNMKFDEVATLSSKSGNELSPTLYRVSRVAPPSSTSAGGQLCAVTRTSCQVQPLVHSRLLNCACAKLCFHSDSPSKQQRKQNKK